MHQIEKATLRHTRTLPKLKNRHQIDVKLEQNNVEIVGTLGKV